MQNNQLSNDVAFIFIDSSFSKRYNRKLLKAKELKLKEKIKNKMWQRFFYKREKSYKKSNKRGIMREKLQKEPTL